MDHIDSNDDCYYLLDNVTPEDAAHYTQLCNERNFEEAKRLYPELHEHVQQCEFCTDILGMDA